MNFALLYCTRSVYLGPTIAWGKYCPFVKGTGYSITLPASSSLHKASPAPKGLAGILSDLNSVYPFSPGGRELFTIARRSCIQ